MLGKISEHSFNFLTCCSSVDENFPPLSLPQSIYGTYSNCVFRFFLQTSKACGTFQGRKGFWLDCLLSLLESNHVACHGTSTILAWRLPSNVDPVTSRKRLNVVWRLGWTWNKEHSDFKTLCFLSHSLSNSHSAQRVMPGLRHVKAWVEQKSQWQTISIEPKGWTSWGMKQLG